MDGEHTRAPDIDQGDASVMRDDPPIFKAVALRFEEVSVLLLDPSEIPKARIETCFTDHHILGGR